MVDDEYQSYDPFSSTAGLAHTASLWQGHRSDKPRSLDMEAQSSSSSSGSHYRHSPPTHSEPRTHARNLPLDRRFKPITETTRAQKTHVVPLDAGTLAVSGGYGSLATSEDLRAAGPERRGLMGRFLRSVGLQKKPNRRLRRAAADAPLIHDGNMDSASDGGEVDLDVDEDEEEVEMERLAVPGLLRPMFPIRATSIRRLE